MKEQNFAFLARKIFLFLLPVLVILCLYFVTDPFKVLRQYKVYDDRPVHLNQGFISMQSYINHRDSMHYDSFILGNSCTMAYTTKDWSCYLPDGSQAIRLNGNGESLDAICQKLSYLDRSGVPIKQVLMLMDYSTLRKVRNFNNHTHILHPAVSGAGNFEFQKEFLMAFVNPKFLIPYIDYCVFGTYRPYMRGIIGVRDEHRNQLTNDIINPREDEIARDPLGYWKKNRKGFPVRAEKESIHRPVAGIMQVKMLKSIETILKRHNTDFKIIVNPSYKYRRLNPADLMILKQIFGSDNVFDFSGYNEYSQDIHNFYEKSHYRTVLGRKILKQVYLNQHLEH